MRHSSVVRALRAGLPTRLVAALHDTSSAMIERHYAAFIVDAMDELGPPDDYREDESADDRQRGKIAEIVARRERMARIERVPAAAVGRLSIASPDHPDAEIFALIERCREVDKLLCAASDAQDKMLWTQVGPAHPPEWTDADASVWPIVTSGEQPHHNELSSLHACLALPALWGTPEFPPQAFADRAREIIAAHDDWCGRLKTAHEHPDVVAAEAERDAHNNEWGELADRLAETPAKTVDGMIAKLAMVATDMAYDEEGIGVGYEGIAESAARLKKAQA